MSSQGYFPPSLPKRVDWLGAYGTKLPKFAPLIGIGPEEVASTLADISNYNWVVNTWYPATHQDTLDNTAFKTLVATGTGTEPVPVPSPRPFPAPPAPIIPGVLNRLFKQVQRIKVHPGYDEGIGLALGIVAVAAMAEQSAPEPTAVLEQGPKGNRVCISYTKHGHGGVAIESRTNGGPWSVFGHFTRATAYDERPVAVPGTPESREYRLCWWDKDEPNGEWSAILTVFVGG